MSRAGKHSALSSALLVVGLCACSSPDPASPDETGGVSGATSMSGASTTAGKGGSGAATGGAGGSSSGGDTGAGSSTGGAAPSSQHHGQVALFNLLANNRVTMTADFVDSSTPAACTRMTEGACTIGLCPEGAHATSTPVSAGAVSITSPELTGSISMMPDATNLYSMSTPTFTKAFSGQEHAVFNASGATVPAFEDQLEVPLVLLLSQPPFAKGMTGIDVDRSQDLSLTWTRGVPGVLLYISGGLTRADGQPGTVGLTCLFPSETGAGVIKSSLLQLIVADSQLSLYTVNTKTITAGDYDVALVVVNAVTNPDKVVIPRLQLH